MNTEYIAELTELDECTYGNQAAEFELHTMRLQISELKEVKREYAALLAKANEGAPPADIYRVGDRIKVNEDYADHYIAQCVALRKQLAEREAEVARLKEWLKDIEQDRDSLWDQSIHDAARAKA